MDDMLDLASAVMLMAMLVAATLSHLVGRWGLLAMALVTFVLAVAHGVRAAVAEAPLDVVTGVAFALGSAAITLVLVVRAFESDR